MMSIFLVICIVFSAIVLQAALLSSAEQYHALKAEKEKADAEAKEELEKAIQVVEADKDLAIYKGFLKLHHENGLEERLLKFTGRVTQKANVTFGKKQLVVHLRGSNDSLDVYALFKEKMPETIKIGDIVTVSGLFDKGTLTGVTLKQSSAVHKD